MTQYFWARRWWWWCSQQWINWFSSKEKAKASVFCKFCGILQSAPSFKKKPTASSSNTVVDVDNDSGFHSQDEEEADEQSKKQPEEQERGNNHTVTVVKQKEQQQGRRKQLTYYQQNKPSQIRQCTLQKTLLSEIAAKFHDLRIFVHAVSQIQCPIKNLIDTLFVVTASHVTLVNLLQQKKTESTMSASWFLWKKAAVNSPEKTVCYLFHCLACFVMLWQCQVIARAMLVVFIQKVRLLRTLFLYGKKTKKKRIRNSK